MARAAVSGRLIWRAATLTAAFQETQSARTLVLDVPGWPGHLPGQHVDVRLTAPDGYRAQRSYSIASAWVESPAPSSPASAGAAPSSPAPAGAAPSGAAPSGPAQSSPAQSGPAPSGPAVSSPAQSGAAPAGPAPGSPAVGGETAENGGKIELTIQRLDDGEVSPYLTDVLEVGDQIELRGPVGGWFVWHAKPSNPALLIAGGSGVVPLMAMVRARADEMARQPFRMIYSVRTPGDVIYAEELARRVREDLGFDLHMVYTRKVPAGSPDMPKRIDEAIIKSHGWPPDLMPDSFICGPTTFVEAVADTMVSLGHDADRIRTERFGGTS